MPSRTTGLPRRLKEKQNAELYEGIEYKTFWEGKQKNQLNQLEHYLVNQLLPDTGERIIDIGCGFGRLANCYLPRFKQAILLDGSITLLKQAREKINDRAFYVVADANNLPFKPACFDCVLLMRVFHHIPNSQALLAELTRVICKNGTLVFNYCNKLNPRQIARWMLRLTASNPFTWEPDGVGTPLIRQHPRHISQLLTQAGCANLKYFGAGIFDKLPELGGISLYLAKLLGPLLGFLKIPPWINCRATVNSIETLK